MKKYKHIVFDVDGTLVDSEIKVLSTLRQSIIDMRGVDHPLSELGFAMGMAPQPILTRLGYDNVEEIVRCWEQHLLHYDKPVEFFAGMLETLEKLSENYTLGVGTSRIYDEYYKDFANLPIFSKLGVAVCGNMVVHRKPAPDILLYYMDKTRCQPSELLFVGDTEFDLGCAQAAKVDFAFAAWGGKSVPEKDCTFYLEKPVDLLLALKDN